MDHARSTHGRGRHIALVAALLALAALLVAPTGAAQAAATVTVKGTVTDTHGYPLPGIDLTLKEVGIDDGPRLVAKGRTDEAGRYTLNKVPADPAITYFMEIEDRTGHHQTTYLSGLTVTKDITRNVRLASAGFIEGTVSVRDGDGPVMSARFVRATAISDDDVNFAATLATSAGRYRLGGLAPGRYKVQLRDTRGQLQGLCYDQVAWDENETCSQPVTLVTVRAGRTTTLEPQLIDQPEVNP
jgi:hypothetical protein